MKGMTRRLATVIVMAAMVSMFAFVGCSGSSNSSSASSSAQSQASTSTESSAAQEASQPAEEVELQIFAANSLSKAMEEVQALYTEEHPEVTFADTQYEGSGTLVEMLGAGSYADALITASKATMDSAEEKGYIDDSTRFDMFTNDLVIVAGENSDLTEVNLEDLASGSYSLAVGDANVPAGNYAKQALSTTTPACWVSSDGAIGPECSGKDGTFDGTPLQGKVTEGSSVGNVCSYANSGDVDLAMVYSSDVYRFGGVKIVSTVAPDTHKNIVYPAAVCSESKHAEAIEEFLDWAFTSEDAVKIWQEWGFEIA